MAIEMDRGMQYRLVVPYLAFLYRTLGEFQTTLDDAKRIDLGLWSLDVGYVLMSGPQ